MHKYLQLLQPWGFPTKILCARDSSLCSFISLIVIFHLLFFTSWCRQSSLSRLHFHSFQGLFRSGYPFVRPMYNSFRCLFQLRFPNGPFVFLRLCALICTNCILSSSFLSSKYFLRHFFFTELSFRTVGNLISHSHKMRSKDMFVYFKSFALRSWRRTYLKAIFYEAVWWCNLSYSSTLLVGGGICVWMAEFLSGRTRNTYRFSCRFTTLTWTAIKKYAALLSTRKERLPWIDTPAKSR